MEKFKCEALTVSGNILSVYFEDGKVMAEGAGKKVQVVGANKYSKNITILSGKEKHRVGLEIGSGHVETMVRSLDLPNRALYMFDSMKSALFAGEGFGSSFDSIGSTVIYCAYKYTK